MCEPTLIDYGESAERSAALDPVTLELSVVFHPAMQGTLDGWPSESQFSSWHDLDVYCVGCPVEDFVRACREWALRVSVGAEEVLAAAYVYSLRQVKYHEEPEPLALALARGVLRATSHNVITLVSTEHADSPGG